MASKNFSLAPLIFSRHPIYMSISKLHVIDVIPTISQGSLLNWFIIDASAFKAKYHLQLPCDQNSTSLVQRHKFRLY